MGTFTQGQISKKKFEVGPEVVQPGPELVQPGPEVVQVGPLLVHSNISSTDIQKPPIQEQFFLISSHQARSSLRTCSAFHESLAAV